MLGMSHPLAVLLRQRVVLDIFQNLISSLEHAPE